MNVEDIKRRGDAQKRWIVEGVESLSQRRGGARNVEEECKKEGSFFSPFDFGGV